MGNVLKLTSIWFWLEKNMSKFNKKFVKNFDKNFDKGYILQIDVEYPTRWISSKCSQ